MSGFELGCNAKEFKYYVYNLNVYLENFEEKRDDVLKLQASKIEKYTLNLITYLEHMQKDVKEFYKHLPDNERSTVKNEYTEIIEKIKFNMSNAYCDLNDLSHKNV